MNSHDFEREIQSIEKETVSEFATKRALVIIAKLLLKIWRSLER